MSMRDNWFGRDGRLSELRRYPREGWIAGVCAGLAETFDWNVKLVRLVFALAFIFGGFFPAGVIYLLLWYLMNEDDGRAGGRTSTPPSDPTPSRSYTESTYSYGDARSHFTRMEERLRNLEECVTSKEFDLRRELRRLES